MRRFLVAVDLDAQAATAVEVAKAVAGPDAAIRVVHAYQMPAAVADGSSPMTREACLLALRKHAGAIPGAEHKMLEGPPATAILEEAQAWRADTIVVAPRSRTTIERFILGSITSQILQKSRSHVLVARPSGVEVERVLVCSDLHEPSTRAAAVARGILQRTRAEGTLLFAADPALWGPDAKAPWPPESYYIDSDWLDRAHQEALHQWLRVKVHEFNLQHLAGMARPKMAEGAPKEVIIEEAHAYDLVITGTHGPNLYERAVLGSVAEHVAARASTSVLVVKP